MHFVLYFTDGIVSVEVVYNTFISYFKNILMRYTKQGFTTAISIELPVKNVQIQKTGWGSKNVKVLH